MMFVVLSPVVLLQLRKTDNTDRQKPKHEDDHVVNINTYILFTYSLINTVYFSWFHVGSPMSSIHQGRFKIVPNI